MRIGIVTGEYPPMEGGVGDFTHKLGHALHLLGHEVHVLTTTHVDKETICREKDLTIHRQINDWGWGVHAKLTRWINATEIDVVNLQYQAAAYQLKGGITLYPRWQRRNRPAPIVVTYHDLLPPYIFPKAGPLRQWTVYQLAQYSDGIIVTNGSDYTTLSKAIGDDAPPVRMIPIGSNIEPCPPDNYNAYAWRTEQGFSPNDLVIGFFGFLNRSKGVETLLDAVAILRDRGLPAHLIFIGGRTGTSDISNIRYAEEIDARIQALDIADHVHRTGFTMPDKVSAALLAIDVCALPYRDGANLRRGTLHAALAHGNAIVTTTPETDTPQLQHEENALLIPPQDPAALAAAIERLWTDKALRNRLGKAAGTLAQKFSWDRIAAHTAEFFRSLTTLER